jgi:hypothetical protein
MVQNQRLFYFEGFGTESNITLLCSLKNFGGAYSRRVVRLSVSMYEGQGHSMTLKQNRVRPITLLFEVGFYNYFPEMITILRRCVVRKFGLLP